MQMFEQDLTAYHAAAGCLDALRRELENADGKDVLTAERMIDRCGKYIIFTPNFDESTRYPALAEKWFGVRGGLHVYPYRPGDPSCGKSFCDFAADDSGHLRLLFCGTDALGEGAGDVSGVILLCPAGGGQQTPAVWSVSQTMKLGTVRVQDALTACRTLCEQLAQCLADSWEQMYAAAEHCFQVYGSLEDGAGDDTLREWFRLNRSIRAGDLDGGLTDAQIEKLDRLGMRWDGTRDTAWEKRYAAAIRYFERHGDLNAPAGYVTADGVQLGAWLTQLRTARKIGLYSSYLTPEHIAELDAAGMVWDLYDFVFERNYHAAAEYYREHGDLECPVSYVDAQGIRLYDWCNYLRRQYKKLGRSLLTAEQFQMLDAIGMRWGSKHDVQWDAYFQCLTAYLKRTGNTDVGATYKEGSVPLGRWYRRQKELYAAGELRKDRADRLLSLGLELTIIDPWEAKFQLAKAYSEAHGGDLNVPDDYVVNGVWLSRWLGEMQHMGEGRRKKKLTDAQREKLESIGMVFGKVPTDQVWERHYQAVRDYAERCGTTELPNDLRDTRANLKSWLERQRRLYAEGRLSDEKIQKLMCIGALTDGSGAGTAEQLSGKLPEIQITGLPLLGNAVNE